MTVIEIPIKDSVDEVVEVDTSELPQQAAEIIGILQEEECTRDLYLRFALGNISGFLELLESGLGKSVAGDPVSKIPLLNALSTYHLSMARLHPRDRTKWLENATLRFNEADIVHNQHEACWIGKGLLQMMSGRSDQASYFFRLILEKNGKFIPALLGKAAILFQSKKYADALIIYQNILRLNPTLKPDPRIGIGLCLWHLGAENRAVYSFERAIDRDSSNVSALCTLATMYYNLAKKDPKSQSARENLLKAMQCVKAAQSVDKNHPLVCMHLSEIMYQKNEIQKSLIVAQSAINNSVSLELKSFLNFLMARAYHVQRKFTDAHASYLISLKEFRDFPLANYGIGKTYMYLGDFKNALVHLEKATSQKNPNQSCKKILAFLHSKDPNLQDKAVSFFKENMEAVDPDVDVIIKYAELLESSHPVESAQAYEKANNVLVTRNGISLYALNNMGALYFNSGRYEDAEKTLEAAKNLCENFLQKVEESKKEEYSRILITLKYNYARVCENVDKMELAVQTYDSIIKEHPRYVDAILRKGFIAQNQEKYQEAGDFFKEATVACPLSVDAWIMFGSMELSKKAYRHARPYFERILKKIDPSNFYSLVALGNDRLLAAKAETKSEQRAELYNEAAKFFDKVLRANPKCVFAANGLAIVLAEMSCLHEARELFSQIREANSNVISAQLNLAHVMVELGLYKPAVAIYEGALKKLTNPSDPQVLLYAARAQYIQARMENSPEDMLSCIKTLQELCNSSPQDLSLSFNLALSFQQYAQLISEKPEESRTLSELDYAMECINSAETLFGKLKIVENKAHVVGYDPDMAGQREKHCVFIRNNVIRQQQLQRANEEIQKEKMEELKKMREKESTRKKHEEEEELKRKADVEKKLFEERQELYEKIMVEQKEAAEKAAIANEEKKAFNLYFLDIKKPSKGTGKRKKDDFIDENGNTSDGDKQPKEKKMKQVDEDNKKISDRLLSFKKGLSAEYVEESDSDSSQ